MSQQQISTTNLYNNGKLGEFEPIVKWLTTRGCNTMFNFSILIIGRLNYKYHRLVASSDRPGELPQVEKCVVDDDEEDEEEVRQMFLCFPGRCFPFYVLKTLWGILPIVGRPEIIFKLLRVVIFGNLRKLSYVLR